MLNKTYASVVYTALAIVIAFTSVFGFTVNAQSTIANPSEIQVTPYKTTMIANGKDEAVIAVKLIDKQGNGVVGIQVPVTFHIKGDARIIGINNVPGFESLPHTDSTWQVNLNGNCEVILQAGRTRGVVKFEAKADKLYPGSTEIHTVQPGTPHAVTNDKYISQKVNGKVLGADISFLPELEDKGIKFSDKGVQKDAITILKEHGFNYIRLRIFNDPANAKGYSPKKGFCDLAHTLQMAKRVKAAGMKLLLDFHYSDYWADPQQQNKPAAWVGKDFNMLKDSVYYFTVKVMQALKAQATPPDMVQIGNEINHGMIWPDGHINNLDSLAQLIYSGVKGVKAVNPSSIIMLHVALGGQNLESRFFFDNMQARNVPYDVIGLSYYPKWHGTLTDLKNNLIDLSARYHKQVMVAEYTQLKKNVNDIVFNIPGGKGVGSFIWEPLNTWEYIFDHTGKSNELINIYPEIAKKYHIN